MNDIKDICESCEEYKNGWKRAVADYKNLQKEMQENKSRTYEDAKIASVLLFLPIYDNLSHAVSAMPDDNTVGESAVWERWAKGCAMIVQQFKDTFKIIGVEEINESGVDFDPQIHESMGEEESDAEHGLVIKIVQAGYKIGGKLIRPAKVILSNKINKQ